MIRTIEHDKHIQYWDVTPNSAALLRTAKKPEPVATAETHGKSNPVELTAAPTAERN